VWKIRLHALSQTWVSRSQVSAIDPVAGLFTYRSYADDGNPSFADWEWRVEPDQARFQGHGCSRTQSNYVLAKTPSREASAPSAS
jgi:hypothetical protein